MGIVTFTIATLRWKLMQVAAWIADHGNIVRLKIATTLEKFNHYIRMMKRMEDKLPCHIKKQKIKTEFNKQYGVVRSEKVIFIDF